MWFKVYAWDGISKMGVFDEKKKMFAKRNEHTVAPYQKLNQAVLAKVHGAISNFYNHKDEDRFDESEERDKELEALVRSGNFNKLYSKFLLGQKAIIKTPERTEDIRGEWVEYLPGQEEALASAAEGTPWCVADPGTGRHYLEYGTYGTDDDGDYDDDEDYDDGDYDDGDYDDDEDYDNHDNDYEGDNGEDNQAKFILFHLIDPKTGNLAENACASIRLGTDGNVTEISGLNDGQALEDSLVPIVEAKVKTLPGGGEFLEAFADKQELIKLDRKMQAGETLSEDDIRFICEVDRPIATLDTYNDEDPRIQDLKEYILDTCTPEQLEEWSVNPNALAKKSERIIPKYFDRLVELGADPNVLAAGMYEDDVAKSLDQLLSLGADEELPESLLS